MELYLAAWGVSGLHTSTGYAYIPRDRDDRYDYLLKYYLNPVPEQKV
jgi:hypothetical protein